MLSVSLVSILKIPKSEVTNILSFNLNWKMLLKYVANIVVATLTSTADMVDATLC